MIAHTFSWPGNRRRTGGIPAIAPSMVTMLALWLPSAQAGEGHDHGDAPATAAAAQALPRFSAVSEGFELVGVLAGQQLTLYLDRAATNEAVHQASIELDIGGRVVKASPAPDGTFQVTLPQALPDGSTPVIATVIEGSNSDLLAGDIDINAGHHGEGTGAHPASWRRVIAWSLSGLAAAAGVLALWWRRRAQRSSRMGGVA